MTEPNRFADESPYAPPRLREASRAADQHPLPWRAWGRGLLMVAATGLLFSIGGALVGILIAKVAPGYYHAVFASQRGNFLPVEVGFGLGLTQGFGAGVVVGLLLVFATAWRYRRRAFHSMAS